MLLFTLFKAIRLFFHPGNYFRIFTGSHHNSRHSILHSKSAYASLLLNEGVHSMEQCSATCENNSSVYNICSQFRWRTLQNNLDIINDHGESKLITHKVPTGNQSADMHLGSYMGYLIGKECTGQDEECKIVVISKDTGFDHIIEFWKTKKDVKVSRNEKISGTGAYKETGKKTDR